MDFINNSLIYEYINSEEYGFYTKENYDFFNIFFKNKENLVKIIDPSDKYHDKNREKAFLYSYFNSLLFFYIRFCNGDEIIKTTLDTNYVTFPLQDGIHYVLLKRNSFDNPSKPYIFNKLLKKNDNFFTNYPNMKGKFINLKDYEGYKVNTLKPFNEQAIFDIISHGFREEHRINKVGKTPLFNKYINEEYPYNDELKYSIFTGIEYQYQQHIKQNKPLIHYINESGRKTGAMEIEIPLTLTSKEEIDYKLMLILDYNEEKKYYELRTILNHQGVFKKALTFKTFDNEILTDSYLQEIKSTNDLIDYVYEENNELIKPCINFNSLKEMKLTNKDYLNLLKEPNKYLIFPIYKQSHLFSLFKEEYIYRYRLYKEISILLLKYDIYKLNSLKVTPYKIIEMINHDIDFIKDKIYQSDLYEKINLTKEKENILFNNFLFDLKEKEYINDESLFFKEIKILERLYKEETLDIKKRDNEREM